MHSGVVYEYSVDGQGWHETFAIPGAEKRRKFVRSVLIQHGVRVLYQNLGVATGPHELMLYPCAGGKLDMTLLG